MQTIPKDLYYVDEHIVNVTDFTPQTTFAEYADYWITYNKQRLAVKTYSRYLALLVRINAGIGHIALGNLKSAHIEEFCHRLTLNGTNLRTGKSLSSKTILHHYRLISVILQSAVKKEIIPYNPCDRQHCSSPKVEKKEIACLQLDDVRFVCANVKKLSCKLALIVLLGLFTGIRRGEIAGLQWQDIDIDRMAILVNRAVSYTAEAGLVIKPPKTPTSNRVVFFYENILKNALKEYKRWYILHFGSISPEYFLFPNAFSFNRPVYPDTISDWAEQASKIIGVQFTMHKLRHTYVSLQIANNTPLKEIAYNVGHSKLTTTCDTYAHLIRLHNKPSISSLENLLNDEKVSS